MKSTPPPVVVIVVEGGIAYVRDLPPGVVVRIYDYDFDGVDDEDLDIDDAGIKCIVSEAGP